MQAFITDVAARISAGYSVIGISSVEEDRVEKALTRLASGSKRQFRVWTASQGFGDGASTPAEVLALIAANTAPTLFLLKDFDPYLADPYIARWLRDLEALQGPNTVLLLSPYLELPDTLTHDVALVEMPLPRVEELRTLLASVVSAVGQTLPELAAEPMARAARGLTARDAQRVFRRALAGSTDPVRLVLEDKERLLRSSELLEFFEPSMAGSELGGLANLKQWLRQRKRAFSPEAREFGLPEPRGVFLLGVQGCGKSLTAKAVADLWQLPLLRLDVAGLVSTTTRSASATLRRTTQVAESMAPCVLWIDEIEKGFHGVGTDSAATRALGAFVTWMQERREPVFVVATANDVTSLPAELLRRGRFDEIFFVDLPDPSDRAEILAIHLAKRGRASADFDLVTLASAAEKLSGAELEQAVVSAMYLAFDAGGDLKNEHIAQAIQETVPLAVTMQEQIESLRHWARDRARPAALNTSRVDYFESRES